MIWFISDTHFCHANIIKYCNRPFKDVDEMNEVLLNNWNSVIQPEDVVYHLGDVVLARKGLLNEIVGKLNGHKILIRGNHDKDITDSRFLAAGFEEVHKGPIILPALGLILSHGPMVSESHLLNVHGHIHNTPPEPKYPFYNHSTHMCISVELTNYMPVSMIEVARYARGEVNL